jgi:hypothetical protein
MILPSTRHQRYKCVTEEINGIKEKGQCNIEEEKKNESIHGKKEKPIKPIYVPLNGPKVLLVFSIESYRYVSTTRKNPTADSPNSLIPAHQRTPVRTCRWQQLMAGVPTWCASGNTTSPCFLLFGNSRVNS